MSSPNNLVSFGVWAQAQGIAPHWGRTLIARGWIDPAPVKVRGRWMVDPAARVLPVDERPHNLPVVVTRHPALVELLRERGMIRAGARVIEHATEEDVRGRWVIGVLPLRLAALARYVTEIELRLTPEDRGRELTIERLREIAGPAVSYTVRRIS